MGYLEGTRAYLSAAIEHANPDDDWRVEPKKILTTRFKIDLFDPSSDPKQQQSANLIAAKEREDYDTVANIAKAFVRKDLSIVDRADYVIAYLDPLVKTFGVTHEIVNSNNAKKPTLIVCTNGGKKMIPSWFFGFIPHTNMFSTWTELYDHLALVDDGKIDDYRWNYVYKKI